MDLGPVGQAGHPVVPTVNISGKTFFNISSQTFFNSVPSWLYRVYTCHVDVDLNWMKKMGLTTY